MTAGCELCVADIGGTGSSLLDHAANAIMVGLQTFREHILGDVFVLFCFSYCYLAILL